MAWIASFFRETPGWIKELNFIEITTETDSEYTL
jgi:hypothetical protein